MSVADKSSATKAPCMDPTHWLTGKDDEAAADQPKKRQQCEQYYSVMTDEKRAAFEAKYPFETFCLLSSETQRQLYLLYSTRVRCTGTMILYKKHGYFKCSTCDHVYQPLSLPTCIVVDSVIKAPGGPTPIRDYPYSRLLTAIKTFSAEK